MQCEQVRNQFTDYVIGQIDDPARLLMEEHLAACHACRSEAEQLQGLWSGLGSIPCDAPSPELRSRFQIMLQAYEHGVEHAARRSWWQKLNTQLRRWWPAQPALQM